MTRLRPAILVWLLSAGTAAAAPATTSTNVNLRAAPGTDSAIVGKIPAGSRVEVLDCTEWCEISWQGKHGFAITTSIDRSGRAPQRRAQLKLELDASDVSRSDVPMSTGSYIAPQRTYGPFFWTDGPDYGRYKGYSGFGYRGRW